MSTARASAKRPLEDRDAPPAKRPRGRPRKDSSVHTATSQPPQAATRRKTAVATSEVPKAGRGRPKGSTSAARSPETVKRGRGRPKNTGSKTTPDESLTASSRGRGILKNIAASKVSTLIPGTPARGRGRPKKDATTAASSKATGGARGRPKKDLASSATTIASGTSGRGRPKKDNTTAASSETVVRGRGRPKKDKSAAHTQSSTPKSGRGRGRPKKATDALTVAAAPATPAHLIITSDVEEEEEDAAVSDDLRDAPIDTRSPDVHQFEL
ncbi:hypothetical protein P171DRAFT_429299 [Karstenula rhodostoma CBS 690.94]|uniref:AT hook domain-containing protein n=1 Tax=Karstenula rhodostoma CBS 690.94 TaxID=1392251 RepID=A0A9P4UDC4_9PLEO|nr:hypothetical protein P171DRAFT_429299 [Karstenula rhodostoma CBS 690.94]